MSKNWKIVLLVIVLLGIAGQIPRFVASRQASEPLTKERYLQEVDKKHTADDIFTKEQYKCAYTLLIDEIGVQETLKIDMRAAADENDVDSRMFKAIERCL